MAVPYSFLLPCLKKKRRSAPPPSCPAVTLWNLTPQKSGWGSLQSPPLLQKKKKAARPPPGGPAMTMWNLTPPTQLDFSSFPAWGCRRRQQWRGPVHLLRELWQLHQCRGDHLRECALRGSGRSGPRTGCRRWLNGRRQGSCIQSFTSDDFLACVNQGNIFSRPFFENSGVFKYTVYKQHSLTGVHLTSSREWRHERGSGLQEIQFFA